MVKANNKITRTTSQNIININLIILYFYYFWENANFILYRESLLHLVFHRMAVLEN